MVELIEFREMGIDQLIIILPAGFVLGMVAMVAREHFRAWRVDPKRRLMPLHVWTIAIAHSLLLVDLMTRNLDWRAFIYFPALCLSAVAMLVMVRYQRTSRKQRDQQLGGRP